MPTDQEILAPVYQAEYEYLTAALRRAEPALSNAQDAVGSLEVIVRDLRSRLHDLITLAARDGVTLE